MARCRIQRLIMASDDDRSAEERLIARYFRPLATAPGAFGLGDDAASLVPPPGCDLVLTTDGVIAGVHFFADDPADKIGTGETLGSRPRLLAVDNEQDSAFQRVSTLEDSPRRERSQCDLGNLVSWP